MLYSLKVIKRLIYGKQEIVYLFAGLEDEPKPMVELGQWTRAA